MGWFRASLGQRLRSLTRRFAAQLLLFVWSAYQLPPEARWRRDVFTMLVHDPIQGQVCKHRCYGDESRVTGRLQRAREVISARPWFPKNRWAPTSVNLPQIYRKPIIKSDANNMQSFILRGDLGIVTKRKNLLGVHFCGLGSRQLFAKLNQR